MTVADLLSSAPEVPITQKGSDQAAFLTAINGVANEGAGGKNWTYEVNGEVADRSFAVYELQPGIASCGHLDRRDKIARVNISAWEQPP